MSRKFPLAEGETSRIACARAVLRAGVEEKTGELLPARVLMTRVGWAGDLVSGMVAALLAAHWNTTDVGALASGADAGGRVLPSNAWMALRRLGWTTAAPEGIRVNDRIVRMAQEQAGRTLHQIITEEIRAICDRRSNLNNALSWAAARWAVDQAIAAGARVIYVEDLRSMQATGAGRTHNTRMSQQVRGQITDHRGGQFSRCGMSGLSSARSTAPAGRRGAERR